MITVVNQPRDVRTRVIAFQFNYLEAAALVTDWREITCLGDSRSSMGVPSAFMGQACQNRPVTPNSKSIAKPSLSAKTWYIS